MKAPATIIGGFVLGALAAGCQGPSYVGGDDVAPRVMVPVYDVVVRNNCSEEVRLGLGVREPDEDFVLGAGRVERLRLRPQERVWLRYRDAWGKDRAASPQEDGWVIEIQDDCGAIVGRRGPL